MLRLPDRGMLRSVNVHRVDLNVLCDWIEACVVFDDVELSKSDVIDVLVEEQIYGSSDEHSAQDFAAERVDDAWAIISRRIAYLSQPLGISVSGNRIVRVNDWTDFPAYGFCLALSCVEMYSQLPANWGAEYVTQGRLFEELTVESFSQTLPGWKVKKVGWAADNNPISLSDAFPTLLADLNESAGTDSQLHLTSSVKDLGLDLLAFYSFDDSQSSFPVFLVQCASGSNWPGKRQTPDIDLWRKIVNFNARPLRAFAIPFAFADSQQFRRSSASVDGMFVERYRLLKSFRQNNVSVSAALDVQLVDWVNPRIAQLPRAT